MGIIDYRHIKWRYKFHIANKPENTGNYYTPEEDKKILDYIDQYGKSCQAIEDLTLYLGRGSPDSVLSRLRNLTTDPMYNVRKQKRWTLAEEKKMLKYLYDEKYIDAEEHSLVNVKASDFKLLAEKTGRTSKSCYQRWQQFVLPILKTHTKGLPLEWNWEWKERLMSYIIKEKSNAFKDINFVKLLSEELFVGQTYSSLAQFAHGFLYEQRNGVKVYHDVPLYEKISQKYDEKSPNIICFNEKKKKAKLEHAQDIIGCYESLTL